MMSAKLLRLQTTEEGQAGFGAEQLKVVLNAFFQRLISTITDHGGDVLRLAGDALIVAFTDGHGQKGVVDPLLLRRAALVSALCLKRLDGMKIEGHVMHLHVALGVGTLQLYTVGSTAGGWQYVAAGEPFSDLATAMDDGTAGEMVASCNFWEAMSATTGKPALNDLIEQSGSKRGSDDEIITRKLRWGDNSSGGGGGGNGNGARTAAGGTLETLGGVEWAAVHLESGNVKVEASARAAEGGGGGGNSGFLSRGSPMPPPADLLTFAEPPEFPVTSPAGRKGVVPAGQAAERGPTALQSATAATAVAMALEKGAGCGARGGGERDLAELREQRT
eukprot:g4508.t1